MNWNKVDEKLPECWSQHGSIFTSGYLLTYDKYGEWEINQYIKIGEHTSKGWILQVEGWESELMDDDGEIHTDILKATKTVFDKHVTHWCELKNPLK